jgi:lipoyl(octanoyl) transferase
MSDAQLLIEKWGFGAEAVEYQSAWDRQKLLHQKVVEGTQQNVVALLEHQSVYTAGRSTQSSDRPKNEAKVFDIDRGGRITWHGPGQLVGYPIMRLPDPIDIVAHVRRIELLLIETCREFGITANQITGRSGVWITTSSVPKKIAAIGIRVAKRVTMHGFAINCNNDLKPFNEIVPCGLADAEVTSLSAELGREVKITEVLPIIERQLLAGALERKIDKSRSLESI